MAPAPRPPEALLPTGRRPSLPEAQAAAPAAPTSPSQQPLLRAAACPPGPPPCTSPQPLRRLRPDPQVLTADWNKYNDCLVATGSIDKSVKVWDVRVPTRELTALYGHAWVAPPGWAAWAACLGCLPGLR
jgi:hypothetical protein